MLINNPNIGGVRNTAWDQFTRGRHLNYYTLTDIYTIYDLFNYHLYMYAHKSDNDFHSLSYWFCSTKLR